MLREVELAAQGRKPIYPLRLDGVEPAGGLQYMLANMQWVELARPWRPADRNYRGIVARERARGTIGAGTGPIAAACTGQAEPTYVIDHVGGRCRRGRRCARYGVGT